SGVVGREIEIADGPGEEAVDRKIVPLHHVAGDAGRDHPPACTVSFHVRHYTAFSGEAAHFLLKRFPEPARLQFTTGANESDSSNCPKNAVRAHDTQGAGYRSS